MHVISEKVRRLLESVRCRNNFPLKRIVSVDLKRVIRLNLIKLFIHGIKSLRDERFVYTPLNLLGATAC